MARTTASEWGAQGEIRAALIAARDGKLVSDELLARTRAAAIAWHRERDGYDAESHPVAKAVCDVMGNLHAKFYRILRRFQRAHEAELFSDPAGEPVG